MAIPWKEVTARPEFQALTDEQKSIAQQQYFDRVVAPQLQGEQVEQARAQFFAVQATPQQQEISVGRAGLRGLNDALTFGFADEISSGLSAALNPVIGSGNDGETFGERYDRNLEGERALNEVGREQHPAASIGGGLIGGILPAVATGGASLAPSAARAAAPAAARSLPQAVGEGAAVGGAYGAAYGLGSGDGDLETRLESAGEGAGLGMLVGGAVPAVIGAGQAARGAVASPERAAERQLERALERDGISPEEFRRRSVELQEKFPNTAMPVDAGGENVAGLMERIANTPGGGRAQVVPALNVRQQGQPERLTDELYQLTGAGKAPSGPALKMSDSKDIVVWDGKVLEDVAGDLAGGAGDGARRSAYRAIQDTMKSRAAAAKPLYEQAYKEPVPWTFELEELMKTPAMQVAYRDASKRAANQQRSFDGKFIDLAEDGTYTVKDVPSTGDLDIMKRSLDDQIGTLLRSGENGKAADIQGIRKQLLGIMDEYSPTYAQARAAWSDPSRYMESIKSGREIFDSKVSPEEFVDIFRRMSPADQEGFRTGAISTIVGRMGDKKTSFADVTADLRSTNMREKVAAILPDNASRARWQELLDHEIAGSQLRRQATGNSSTFRRGAEADDADDFIANAAGAARDAMSTTLTGFLNRAVPASYKWARDRVKVRSDAALADRLINPKSTAAPLPKQEPPKRLASQGGAAAIVPGTVGGEQAARLGATPTPVLAAPEDRDPDLKTVDGPVDKVRPNGKPFQARGDARVSKAYRDAARAGLSPEVVQVEGGFAVRVAALPNDKSERLQAVDGVVPGMIERGNIDLNARPVVQNKDGSISTVRSLSANIDGLEVLIPTIAEDGRLLSDEEAIEQYQRSGQNLGKFDTPEAATAYAEALHRQQEDAYPIPEQLDQIRSNGKPFQARGDARVSKTYRDAVRSGLKPEVVSVPGGFAVRVPAQPPEAPTSKSVDEQPELRVRQNGQPFQGRGDARASLLYRNAVKAGEKPEVVKHGDGWAVAIPKPVSRIASAANEAATSPTNDLAAPTEAQKEAGNYKKGHVRIGGLDITVENPKGSERSGRRPDGSEWRHTMNDHYGYLKRSKGADDEQVDAYIGPLPFSPQVFIVDQVNQQDDSFDEHKVMIGYPTERAAVAAYKSNFDIGWKVGQVTKMPLAEFKAWLKEGDQTKPASERRQTLLRKNGKPFDARGDARVSLAYRNAMKAGRKPEVVQVEGGWGVQV